MVWREITEEGLWGGKMAEQSFMEGQALTTILVNSWVDMSRVWILPSSPPARLWTRMTSILPFNRDDLMGTWMALVPDRSSHRWPRQGHLDGNIIAFTTLLGEVIKGTFIHFMKGFFFFLHVGIRMLGSYEQSRFMHWWKNQLPLPFSSKTLCVCVCAQSLCHVQLSVIPWTVAHQPPWSTGFSRQEYWNGLPFPTPGDLPHPGTEPTSLVSPALVGGFSTTEPSGNANSKFNSSSYIAHFPATSL